MELMKADYLLIDVGNGRTKFALSARDGLLERRESATHGLGLDSLQETLAGWSFGRAVVCSVVPAATEQLRKYFGPSLIELKHDGVLGIGVRYPQPASIGPDRLANAVALSALYAQPGEPGIVIDFGTAVTFDVLSADHHYIGGVIAPGLRLMTDYLHERTALLPRVELREPVTAIGQSTEEAILAGAAIGYRGMVRGILDSLRKELAQGDRAVVVATGGDSEWIVKGIDGIQAVAPDLTLHGLRLVGNLAAPFAP
ncbi:MAG: baf: pantothenate kinase type iii [Verrucomicrobiaceae bacterium]|nr:baf: pantothenate kinase type iii [Verrucomicrobiaceae bacterium]